MNKRNFVYYVRKSHRYLGVIIGIQFLFWTIGGLYFSWTKIEHIRGENLRAEAAKIPLTDVVSPAEALRPYVAEHGSAVDLTKLKIVSVLGEPHYYLPLGKHHGTESILLRASDGTRREPLTKDEAVRIASAGLEGDLAADGAKLVTEENVGGHHEYRGKPLPAWAVSFKDTDGLVVYVGAGDGQIHALRTDSWRVFDFLWMLHTLDVEGRDDINNYLLRAFSIFGILSLLSGFLLYVVTSKTIKRLVSIGRPPRSRNI